MLAKHTAIRLSVRAIRKWIKTHAHPSVKIISLSGYLAILLVFLAIMGMSSLLVLPSTGSVAHQGILLCN
jgi:metallophosphoesterase superfamily enzyme